MDATGRGKPIDSLKHSVCKALGDFFGCNLLYKVLQPNNPNNVSRVQKGVCWQKSLLRI